MRKQWILDANLTHVKVYNAAVRLALTIISEDRSRVHLLDTSARSHISDFELIHFVQTSRNCHWITFSVKVIWNFR